MIFFKNIFNQSLMKTSIFKYIYIYIPSKEEEKKQIHLARLIVKANYSND